MRMASKASKKEAAQKSPATKTAGKRAAKKTAKKTAKKASKKKAPAKAGSTRPVKAREKDPKGGLTAAGRSAFARRDGSHLKPGVTKALSDMTHTPQRQLGGTILWPQETSSAGRWPGKTDGARAVRPRLGRACSTNGRSGAAHRCQGRTAAATLSADQAKDLTPASANQD
jgi:hypothetical protein